MTGVQTCALPICLLDTLKHLRDLGNTVMVVEHDEEAMLAADHIVDMGPGAGVHGGQIVAQGTPEDVVKVARSYTGQFLKGVLRRGKKEAAE